MPRQLLSVVIRGPAVKDRPRTVTFSPRGHSLTKSSRPATRSETRTVVLVRSIGSTTFASTSSLLGKVDQHDITHLEPLHDVLHRHQSSVFGAELQRRVMPR